MFSEKKSLGFFQKSLRGLNIFIKLLFKTFRYFIYDFHIAITEFVD